MKTFKEETRDWTDWDVAAYRLGIAIGLMPDQQSFGATKHVFWSIHPVGDMLYGMLNQMVLLGILEKRDKPDLQCRWSTGYRGSWED